ncbi:MAG: hypothetical protein QOC87_2182, partial [Actinomycetota bacterium]|nr:hypothetical protein [Actinomycetota bacterium]
MPSKKLVIAVIVIVVVGALGGLAYRIYLNPAHDNAIDLVPSDAFFYASVFLDPSTHQKQALGELLRHFPEAKTPSLAKGELENLLNDALASTGVDFTHDVEPWIGRQVAFFADGIEGDSADVAFLVGTSDADAARATLAKAATHSSDLLASHESYRGNDFTVVGGKARGIVGNFVVLASDANVFEKVVRTQ